MSLINSVTETVPESVKKSVRYYETGHAKNVANFETLLSYVNAIGPEYNPSKSFYQLAALDTLMADAKIKLNEVNVAMVQYTQKVTTREVVFSDLNRYVDRIYAALKVNEDSPEVLEDARRFVRKLKGRRAKPVSEENLASGNFNSVSQVSYDSRTENFEKLVELISINTHYAPNEESLQVPAIRAYLEELKAANTVVRAVQTDLVQARMSRNALLYRAKSGLFDVSKGVKIYLDSILDKDHAISSKIKKIKFSNL